MNNTKTFHRDVYRVDDRVIINSPTFLKNVPATVVAISDITGQLTLKLIEGRNAWQAGDLVGLMPFEVRRG